MPTNQNASTAHHLPILFFISLILSLLHLSRFVFSLDSSCSRPFLFHAATSSLIALSLFFHLFFILLTSNPTNFSSISLIFSLGKWSFACISGGFCRSYSSMNERCTTPRHFFFVVAERFKFNILYFSFVEMVDSWGTKISFGNQRDNNNEGRVAIWQNFIKKLRSAI